MTIELPDKSSIYEEKLESAVEMFSELDKNYVVLANEIRHFCNDMELFREKLKDLATQTESHTKDIEKYNRRNAFYIKIFSMLGSNWWKIILAVSAVDAAYNIVKVVPKG